MAFSSSANSVWRTIFNIHWRFGFGKFKMHTLKKFILKKPWITIILGIVGNGAESDIAIDAITFTNSSCPISPSKAEPSNSSISCTFDKGKKNFQFIKYETYAVFLNRSMWMVSWYKLEFCLD